MESKKPDTQGMSIVLVGDFSPRIFQPAWFASEQLLRKQEADAAAIQIIHADIVDFSLEWCHLVVTQERFFLSTSQEPYYEPLRDLVLGTFKLLAHTPLKKMGINLEMQFRVESEKIWHQYGHRFAPKEPWSAVFDNPGLRSLTMEESRRRDGRKGYVRTTIQPSEQIHPAVFFLVNDHYETSAADPVLDGLEMMKILEESWDASTKRSAEIIYTVLKNNE